MCKGGEVDQQVCSTSIFIDMIEEGVSVDLSGITVGVDAEKVRVRTSKNDIVVC